MDRKSLTEWHRDGNASADTYADVLRKCRLLAGVPEECYQDALKYFECSVITADTGERLISAGDEFRYAYFILEGEMSGSFINEAADRVVLNHFYAGNFFGEAMALIPHCRSTIDLEAECRTVLLSFNLSVLASDKSLEGWKLKTAANLTRALAGQNYFLNQKVRILGQKSIRDRLSFYFSTLSVTGRGDVVIPYSKTELAAYLGVNRSAMIRELGRMRDEGLIEVKGRHIKWK